jgi:hypothetical protein
MVLDILKPVLYCLEKSVAKKNIPDVSQVRDRKLLKDHPATDGDVTFDHSKWNAVLQRHVTIQQQTTVGGIQNVHVVDYCGVAQDPDYAAYLEQLATAKPAELAQAQQLAFWMNVYNALCINIIVTHEKNNENSTPLQSINNLSQPGQPVWGMVAGQVNGKDVSLNEVEHEQLRKHWAEPAIHGCIVCASASCPNLRQEAFVGERLREQMDDQMRDFLSNPTKGLTMKHKRLTLSRIFLWFENDFDGWRGIREWIPQFIKDEKEATEIKKGKVSLRYFDYDWSINRA